MTIPSTVRSAVGLDEGGIVEVRAIGKKIVITPRQAIDRSRFPTADDEYTPVQRRTLDASLAKAEKGPYYGPFKNGAEIAAFLKKRPRTAGRPKSKRVR